MGYESKLYLVLGSEDSFASPVYAKDEEGALLKDENDSLVVEAQGRYTQVVAMIDLSKAGYEGPVATVIRDAITRQKTRNGAPKAPAPWGIYIGGDDFVVQDPYGDPLSEVPLDALIDALEVSYQLEAYRRFGLALALLKGWRSLLSDFGGPTHARVLHYGH